MVVHKRHQVYMSRIIYSLPHFTCYITFLNVLGGYPLQQLQERPHKVISLYSIGHNILIVASIMASSIYNTSHKELLPTKLQFKLDKNPTWPRITDVVSTIERGLLARLRRMLYSRPSLTINLTLVLNARHPIMDKSAPYFLLVWASIISNSSLPLYECLE
jgi:hypothetical protein